MLEPTLDKSRIIQADIDPGKTYSGMVFYKIYEQFNDKNCAFDQIIAEISRENMRLKYILSGEHETFPEEIGTINPEGISLGREALPHLQKAMHYIDWWWNERPLPKGEVLFTCGCQFPWDTFVNKKLRRGETPPEITRLNFLSPEDFKEVSNMHRPNCPIHKMDKYSSLVYDVYRYNLYNFATALLPHRHLLLLCGDTQIWDMNQVPKEDVWGIDKAVRIIHPKQIYEYPCKLCYTKQPVVRYNEEDFLHEKGEYDREKQKNPDAFIDFN